jgi:hypothetical protein
MFYAECPSVKLSRVVVLSSRPVERDTVNKLKQESNFITERVHLDGQGRLQVKSSGPGGHLRLRVVLGRIATYSSRSVSSRIGWILKYMVS